MMDNRGCSGGTGVENMAFGVSDVSQNDFTNELGVMENSLVRLVELRKSSNFVSTDQTHHYNPRKSMSPEGLVTHAEKI